ncbi:unnamed protein product [Urochloa humidicola]
MDNEGVPDGEQEASACAPILVSEGEQEDEVAQQRTIEEKLKAFTEEVVKDLDAPLVPKPSRTKTKRSQPATAYAEEACELPKRSEHLANHPLANVASSKRAEVVLMKRFQILPEGDVPVTSEAKQAYQKFYNDKMVKRNYEAVKDLIPSLRNASPMLGMQA